MAERRYSSWMLERIGIGDTVRLRIGESTIGRHSSSVIRIADSGYVSRHHAVIQVSEDDRNVTLRDVSSNGVYINEVRQGQGQVTIHLNINDIIGIGVTTIDLGSDVDVLNLPIYELKYAPIRPIRSLPSNVNRSINSNVLPSPTAAPAALNAVENNNKPQENNANNGKEQPCCSKTIKNEKIQNAEEIFEISDDDDDNKPETSNNLKKLKAKENDLEQSKSIHLKQENDLVIIKKEPKEDVDNKVMNSKNETKKDVDDKVTNFINLSPNSPEKTLNDNIGQCVKDAKESSKQNDIILTQIKQDANKEIISQDICKVSLTKDQQNNVEVFNMSDKKSKEISRHNDNNSNKQEKENATNQKLDEQVSLMHVPIISNIKKEIIRSVSADIDNIFGDLDENDELKKTIKEINPLVYKEIQVTKNLKPLKQTDDMKILNNGDCIVLTDDEDLEVEELGTITSNDKETKEKSTNCIEQVKSPNIFENSLDNSKGDESIDKDNESKEAKKDNNDSKIDNIDLDEYTKYVPNSDDEDIEDLIFSQVIMNDMKAEVPDDLNDGKDNDSLNNLNLDNFVAPCNDNLDEQILAIKQEPGLETFSTVPTELDNSCWIISDDEDYDEELETKVNDWSNRIFSQSFNLLSQNMSQVYDLNEEDNKDLKDDELGEDNDYDDNDDDFNLLEDDIDGIASIYNSHKENDNEKKEELLVTTKSDDELKETKVTETLKVSNKKENLEAVVVLEKLTTISEESKLSPNKESNDSVSNLTESPVIRIRRLSKTKPVITSPSSSEDEFQLDNKNLNKPETEKSTTPITTRLPPPVIDAPALPKHKGKLRGVSAELPKKSSNEFKTASVNKKLNALKDKFHQERYTKDLKRKWLEKPSIAKKRDKEHKKFIKECRKDKLKELAERKKSPSKENIKRKLSTDDHHDHKAKMAKVKVTTYNRGAFLVEPTPAPSAPNQNHKTADTTQFKIPKVTKKMEDNNKKEPLKRSMSIDGFETFSQQISKADILLLKRPHLETKKSDKSITPSSNKTNTTHPVTPLRRHSTTESPKHSSATSNNTRATPSPQTSPICKEAIAARAVRTTNKITFASMEKNIIESEENKRKLCALSSNNNTNLPPPAAPINNQTSLSSNKPSQAPITNNNTNISTPLVPLSNQSSLSTNIPPVPSISTNIAQILNTNKSILNSCLKSSSSAVASSGKRKSVRFNDTPVIHYIERVTGACKKINNKDVMPMTTYRDRRHLIRTVYPLIDHTDAIITKILCWSNEWLIKRNADAEAAGDIIYPMPTHFNSFEQYKSIIFPLMKLEFVSTLECEYNMNKNVKKFKVSLEYATHNKDRIMLVTKFANNQSKEVNDSSRFDLVILEADKAGPQIFAYVVAYRKGAGSFVTIVYEIVGKNFTIEYFKAIKEFQVRPVMDKVRVHFAAFNAVYQLQSTPLFQKIINPLELLKCRPPPKKKVVYRGFDPLNDKQRQVLLNTYTKIIDETTPNITLIQGPPGTGKSCVITNLVLQTLYGEEVRYLDKKVLICAQSNAAVDVIAGKLYDISLRMRPEKRFRVIRYGMLNKIHPNVLPIALQKVVERDQLKKLQAKNKDIQLENKENLKNQILQFEAQIADMSSRNVKGTVEEDMLIEKKRQLQLMRNILNENMRPEDERSLFTWYLSNANIVCCTLSSCVNLMQYINFFDICIIDEATQCTEPYTLLPLKFGINSLVLVGDTQQLPATVLSKKANDLGLGTSMFTRVQHCLDNIPTSSAKGNNVPVTTPNSIICSLQTQYRMHPEICRWPNQYFYRNELINGKSALDFTKTPLVPFCILNLAYNQNTTNIKGKISNDLEAEFVAKLLKALDGFIPNKYNSYGVITPYAHHRANLETSIRSLGLTNIMVNTIDSYQGCEKDVIVISNARTNGIGFLANPQRLNVALTRAKKCLILCGNFKNLETVPAWRCLLQSARERKLYHEISANCVSDIQTNVMDKIKLKNQT